MQRDSTFIGSNIPLLTSLPVPQGFPGLTSIQKSEKLIRQFQNRASAEFHDKRLNQGWFTLPNHPLVNDSKPTMQFITPVSYMPESPVITYSGVSRLKRERAARIANKRPGNSYYKIPLLAKMGPTSLFGRGTGWAVDKYAPLPFMNDREERMKRVSWKDQRANLGSVQRIRLDPRVDSQPIRTG